MTRTARTLAHLLLCATLAAPSAAWAKESVDAQVKRLANESHAKYQAGDYAGAAELLSQAYELKPDPTLLFNIAKTFEKAGNTEQAMRYYQRYIDSESADPKLVKQAVRALEKLRLADEERKRKEAEAKAKEEADRKAEQDRLAAEARRLEEERQRQEQQQKQQQAQAEVKHQPPAAPERPSKVPGIVLLGVGAGAAIAGGVVGITAQDLANQEKASVDPVQKPDLRTRARTRAAIADVCYGVGTVSAAVGVVLLVRALRAPEAPVSEATPSGASGAGGGLQLLLLPGGAGLGYGGAL